MVGVSSVLFLPSLVLDDFSEIYVTFVLFCVMYFCHFGCFLYCLQGRDCGSDCASS